MQSNIRVVNQDATLLFKEIPDNSIDLIVTDPPYPVIGGGSNVNDDVGRPRGNLNIMIFIFLHGYINVIVY